jgi:hypothetical protein
MTATEQQTQTQTVTIERAPPKRLYQSLRWRSFKLPEQRSWFQTDMGPVYALIAAGWRVTRVEVEFGGAEPLTADAREARTRELTDCQAPCVLVMTCGQPGRGRTTLRLERT